MSTVSLGKLGEDLAKQYLLDQGYSFITANFHSKAGEIDLVFQDTDTLVFVEVKTRHTVEYGPPEEAVTPWKLKAIIRTGEYFKTLHPEFPKLLRVDVIAIDLTSIKPTLRHLENVTG